MSIRGEIRVTEHTFITGHIDFRDVADHQDGLLHLAGIAYQILDLPKAVIILLALLVNLDRLLKIVEHIASRRGRVDDVLGGIDDALGQIPGVGHYPLGVCLACRKKADTA